MAEASDMSKNQKSEILHSESNGGKKIEAGILLDDEAASQNSKGQQDAETTEGGGGGGGIFLRGRMSFRSFHGKRSRRRGNWDEEMMYTMRDQPMSMDDETMSARHNNASSGLEKMEPPPPSDGTFDTQDNDSESDTDTESEAMRDFYRNIALSQERNAALINELNNDDPDDFVDRFLRFRGQGDIIDMLMWDLQLDGDESNSQTTYPIGELRTSTECLICFNVTSLNLRPCCAFPVCNSCLETYFQTQVSEAIVKIACPNTDCAQKVHRDEILARLNVTMKVKFNQFLVDANKEPHRKTCPRCSSIMTIDLQLLREPLAKKFGVQVGCADCGLDWCFPCQAPWHEAMKCKEYRRGDKLVKAWALERPHGQFNAQKCPKCKVFIQRSTGCDHMTCSQCNTHFCYQCGEKFREFKFIGNHYSRLSIFGCKYLYDKEKPIERKFVRGSIFGAKLLAAPILGGLALGAGAVVAGIGLVVLPFYGGYKLHKKLQQTRQMKRHRAELLNYRLRTPYPEWEPNRPQSFPNIVITEHMSTNEESGLSAAAAAATPSNQDLNKDEIDKLERSFFHAAKADSLMRCGTNVAKDDGDQSSVGDASSDASIAGRQVVAAGDDHPSIISKSPDQSTIEAYFRLKALSEGRFETAAEADTGDSSVTKTVLNSDPAIPAMTASKGEEIAERVRFETPLLVASKLGEIFV